METIDLQKESLGKLQNSLAILQETNDTATKTAETLKEQTEQIKKIRATNEKIGVDVNSASTRIQRMSKREKCPVM